MLFIFKGTPEKLKWGVTDLAEETAPCQRGYSHGSLDSSPTTLQTRCQTNPLVLEKISAENVKFLKDRTIQLSVPHSESELVGLTQPCISYPLTAPL